MEVQYGDACLSLQQVYEWTGQFMNGISSVADSPVPGHAHRVVTPEDIAAVEAIVKANRRVTANETARTRRLHRKMKSLCVFRVPINCEIKNI